MFSELVLVLSIHYHVRLLLLFLFRDIVILYIVALPSVITIWHDSSITVWHRYCSMLLCLNLFLFLYWISSLRLLLEL